GAEALVSDCVMYIIIASAHIVRSAVEQVPMRTRDTMRVSFAAPCIKARIVGPTLNYVIDDLEDEADQHGNENDDTETTEESTVQDQVPSDTDLQDEGE